MLRQLHNFTFSFVIIATSCVNASISRKRLPTTMVIISRCGIPSFNCHHPAIMDGWNQ